MPSWQDTKAPHVHTGKKCQQGYSEHTDKVQGGAVPMKGELADATYRRATSLQLMGTARTSKCNGEGDASKKR